ncbi:MAG: hypothetical protein WBM90_05970, partial [Acidimicrobiia bacterium]
MPDHLSDEIEIGRIVRVPLSGRKVRGWVVQVDEAPKRRLKEIAGISGDCAVFDEGLLESLRWAAHHYVAPVSVLLSRAAPPNLPRRSAQTRPGVIAPDDGGGGPIGEIAEAVGRGRRLPTQVIVGRWQSLDWLLSLGPVLARGTSVLIVAASAAEVEHIVSQAENAFGDHLVSVAGQDDASLTSAWVRSQVGGVLVVGTPRTATWRIGHLGMVIVLEEARRAMKDRQTPTLHVRDVVRSRSLLEGITAIFFGPTPSVEVLSTGAETRRMGTRAWPLVEVIDRSNEGPGSGMLDSRVIKAIIATSERHLPTFVLGSVATVERLGQELDHKVGSHGIDSSLVNVGTERDLAGLVAMGLVVASNPDGTLLSRGYRTSEEVLRVLARLANS